MYLTDLMVDLFDAAKAVRYGLVLECIDPFRKAEIEKKLNEFGLRWIPAYIEQNRKYVYIISGGKKEKAKECAEWFRKVHECSTCVSKSIYQTKVTCLCWEA